MTDQPFNLEEALTPLLSFYCPQCMRVHVGEPLPVLWRGVEGMPVQLSLCRECALVMQRHLEYWKRFPSNARADRNEFGLPELVDDLEYS